VQRTIVIAAVLSSAIFLWYGAGLLGSRSMVAEFERYQLAPYRRLTGALQVVAAAGLLAGLLVRPLLLLAAGGLAVMMLGAVAVRLRVRDPLPATIPALVLFCLNVFLVLAAR
jgi:DoxX-like family